jgi:sugar phosphate isomerase/epimerase
LQGSLAAAALSTQPLTLLAESDAPAPAKQKFCAFEKPLTFLSHDELAEFIIELGFDGIEATVREGGRVAPDKVDEELPKLVEALHKRGRELTILTSDINTVEQPYTEPVLRAAAKLGIKYYRMLWFRYDLEKPILPQLDALRPKLKRLAALNRELGITALYQNHAGPKLLGAPLWDIYDLIKEFPPREISLAYDIRHAAVEGGMSWPIQFKLIQSHLGALYVKDFRWEKNIVKNTPLGKGQVDPAFFATFKKLNFSGPISLHIEYLDGRTDRKLFVDAFKNDLATLRSWLASD